MLLNSLFNVKLYVQLARIKVHMHPAVLLANKLMKSRERGLTILQTDVVQMVNATVL